MLSFIIILMNAIIEENQDSGFNYKETNKVMILKIKCKKI